MRQRRVVARLGKAGNRATAKRRRGTRRLSLEKHGSPSRANMFSELGRCNGFGVFLSVAERVDGPPHCVRSKVVVIPGKRRSAILGEKDASVLACLGHAQRLRILWTLLDAPGTYRALAKATGLRGGPLYFHVAQLRLAGLVRVVERDLYESTRSGRIVLLAALGISKAIRGMR
ncbi:MAG: winged helix-turn-helix domain-containing protein [Planctomycetota bacterium]